MATVELGRRRFLQVAALSSLGFGIVACGSDDEGSSGDSTTQPSGGSTTPAGPLTVPKLAHTHPVYLIFLPGIVGPMEYGKDFGLDYKESDSVVYDSHAVATQAVLSKQSDVVLGSTAAALTLISGQPEFKIFGQVHAAHDLVIAVNEKVTDLDGLFESSTRFGVDSPGGSGSMGFLAMLRAEGDDRGLSDLGGLVVLESSGQRATSLGSDSLDAGIINSGQFLDLDTNFPGKFKTLAELDKSVPDYLASSLFASTAFLDENIESLAALNASIMTACREMYADADLFAEMAAKYLAGGAPSDAVLESTWNRIQEGTIWNVNGDIPDAAVENMISLAQESELFTKDLSVDDVLDRRVSERALELVGGKQ